MSNDYTKPQGGQTGGQLENLKRIAENVAPGDIDAAIATLNDIKKKSLSENYITDYFSLVKKVVDDLSMKDVEDTLNHLVELKKRKGRLFLLGIGGSAGNCSHAVNDFRKIANIESYAPTDNVSELTARANDDGWETIFSAWLKGSKLTKDDAILVFSVGGGNLEKNVSTNIVKALQYGKEIGCTILGIVSRDGGYTRKVATTSILVPVAQAEFITPVAEAFQAVIWHMMVTHPKLRN
jgi:D-sedoheptulose 7-phosphate isomerase